jgi:hypothetical protein
MTDVIGAVERRLVTRKWPVPLSDGCALAELIANECSGILFDIDRYRDKWLQVREIYENAIAEVVCSLQLISLAKAFLTLLLTVQQANRESDIFRRFSSALSQSRKWAAKEGERERYVIGEEVGLLNKIKDIRDELNMIITIFQTQTAVLDDPDLFKTLSGLVNGRIKELKRLDQQALNVQEAVSLIRKPQISDVIVVLMPSS